ncbi:MAG: 2,3-bisphosphoglycerate-independent phosphoglycerate mutase 1 [Candidatus Thorarchaeota archaeon]|nr:MAG: 2,3-bisphosphoglycerate-independent phosphoglycerate mutase 1 [Candidatus Thorarchaeota archaeon]
MTEKRAAILLVMDGGGDRGVKDLDGQTPFQAAHTPNLDSLAKSGQNGLLDVIGPGITPGSDTAHLALFGYDPASTYPGRGPLEALGAGLDSRPGDVAFRSNFATVNDDMVVLDRRAGRDFTEEEGKAFKEVIDKLTIEDVTVHFTHTVEHRGALILRGPNLSADITDIDPHETGEKILTCEAENEEAEKTARIINKMIEEVHNRMKGLKVNQEREERGLPPANVLLLRGPGKHQNVSTLQNRFGIRSAVIAGGALYIGTAKYVGMEHLPVDGQTGTIETNFTNIAKKTIEAVETGFDYLFLHIKATDNASHDMNYEEKILAIEKTDEMIGRILERVSDKIVIGITGDHTTPVTVGDHTCDPVPLTIWADFIRSDDVEHFSEFHAANGSLHGIRGKDVMNLLLGYAGHIEKYGA